jgi:hypothetical protein
MRDADGLWLITRRLKTETQTRREAFLPIKCHPLLSGFLEKYLLLVRPVLADLIYELKGEEAYHLYSEYMWTKQGRRMTADEGYSALENFMRDYCGVRVGAHDYRQICVEIGRVYLGSGFEIDEEQMDILAAQAGHTAQMARLKYAAELGQLPCMSSDLLLRFGRVSEAWWEVTGFKPDTPPLLPLRWRMLNRLAPFPITNSATMGLVTNPTAQTTQPVIDTVKLIEIITATIIHEIGQVKIGLTEIVREAVAEALAAGSQFQQQSRVLSSSVSLPPPAPAQQPIPPVGNWDDDIYVPYSPASPPPPPPELSVQSTIPQSSVQSTICQQSPSIIPYTPTSNTQAYMEDLLKKHFPNTDNPQFKTEMQMQGVELAMARLENFVAVMPTGSGKSLLFTLPPFNESGFQTYVIIPNKALLVDQDEKAKRVGLSTTKWTAENRMVLPGHNVVFLAIGSATCTKFNE